VLVGHDASEGRDESDRQHDGYVHGRQHKGAAGALGDVPHHRVTSGVTRYHGGSLTGPDERNDGEPVLRQRQTGGTQGRRGGGVGALFSDGAGMRGQFSHGNLLRDIEAMRGKGGSSLERSCGWGCASDFELQRAARRKTAQQEVARKGQPDALVRERFLLVRQQSRHQNTLPWSIPVAPSVREHFMLVNPTTMRGGFMRWHPRSLYWA